MAEPISPTVSGLSDSVLSHDMNVLRTMVQQVKGTSNWFGTLPTFFDPSNTNPSNLENGETTLSAISGNTLDSKL